MSLRVADCQWGKTYYHWRDGRFYCSKVQFGQTSRVMIHSMRRMVCLGESIVRKWCNCRAFRGTLRRFFFLPRTHEADRPLYCFIKGWWWGRKGQLASDSGKPSMTARDHQWPSVHGEPAACVAGAGSFLGSFYSRRRWRERPRRARHLVNALPRCPAFQLDSDRRAA